MLELLDITGILFIEEICRLIDTEITIFTNLQLRKMNEMLNETSKSFPILTSCKDQTS